MNYELAINDVISPSSLLDDFGCPCMNGRYKRSILTTREHYTTRELVYMVDEVADSTYMYLEN